MGNIDTAKANRGKAAISSALAAAPTRTATGARVVVRRLKHTPNLPMPYIFSEATENREVRHILGARHKKRAQSSRRAWQGDRVPHALQQLVLSSHSPIVNLQVFVAIAQPILSVGFIQKPTNLYSCFLRMPSVNPRGGLY